MSSTFDLQCSQRYGTFPRNSFNFVSYSWGCCSSGRPLPPTSAETPITSPRHSIHHSESIGRSPHDHARSLSSGPNDLNKQNSPARQQQQQFRRPGSMAIPHRPTNLGLDLTPQHRKPPQPSLETKTDYGKYRYH